MFKKRVILLCALLIAFVLIYVGIGLGIRHYWPGYQSVVMLSVSFKLLAIDKIAPPDLDLVLLVLTTLIVTTLLAVPWRGLGRGSEWSGYGGRWMRPARWTFWGLLIIFGGGLLYELVRDVLPDSVQGLAEAFGLTFGFTSGDHEFLSISGGVFSVLGLAVAAFLYAKFGVPVTGAKTKTAGFRPR